MIQPTLVPLAIKPPVYELTVNLWHWCKLGEVRALVPELARAAGMDFNPTPEELVSNFAGLTRYNHIPEHVPVKERDARKKKLFRFSVDGVGLSATKLPCVELQAPPYAPFQLSIDAPYPETLFVTEEWATDVLRAIRAGAVRGAWWDGLQVGFPPRESGRDPIVLGKENIGTSRKAR